MNHYLHLLSAAILAAISLTACNNPFDSDDSSDPKGDRTAPELQEDTPIATTTGNIAPNYTFTSTERGFITYSGSCTSEDNYASAGYNRITFDPMPAGTYSDCEIKVTDSSDNVSKPLVVSSFTIALTSEKPIILSLQDRFLIPGFENTLTGLYLDSAKLYIDGSEVTPIAQDFRNLRFMVPALVDGFHSVKIENADGARTIQYESSLPLATTGVDAGEAHICTVLPDQTVGCWGDNNKGQLGDGSHTDRAFAVKVVGIGPVASVAVGSFFSCALLADSSIGCWGLNDSGQLGNGTNSDSAVPVAVSGIGTAKRVSAGFSHACAILADETVRCWGANSSGELGNNSSVNSPVPVVVQGLGSAQSLALGFMHSCALLADGTVHCWGSNFFGQLGDSGDSESLVPVEISDVNNAVAIGVGLSRSCAVLADGAVKCWGVIPTSEDLAGEYSPPVLVSGISNAVDISLGNSTTSLLLLLFGFDYACVLLDDGQVKCWGVVRTNTNGVFNLTTEPKLIEGISNAVSVKVGSDSACARLATGEVRCWGYLDGERVKYPQTVIDPF
jgi:alpha-tubulin suppressor-like RCC1 family protein